MKQEGKKYTRVLYVVDDSHSRWVLSQQSYSGFHSMVANENKEMVKYKDERLYNTLRGEPVVEQKEIDEMGKTESFLDVENNLGLIIFLRRFIDS